MLTRIPTDQIPQENASLRMFYRNYSELKKKQPSLTCQYRYCDGFVWNLKNFIAKHGDGGKDELNSVCQTHTITLVASPKVSYCGCDVEDGKLRLIFHPEKLGTNISHVGQELAETLSNAPPPAGAPSLNYAARHSIKTEYDPKIGALVEKGRKLLHNAQFKFDPDFDTLGAKLKGANDASDNWESNFGSYCFKYFESFVDVLEREKFGDDELLREGLEEAASKGTVKLRLVDNLKSGYNEVLVDDGVLVIQVRFASASLNFIALTASRQLLRSGEQTSTTLVKSLSIFYKYAVLRFHLGPPYFQCMPY